MGVGLRGGETMFDLFSSYSFAPSYEREIFRLIKLGAEDKRKQKKIYIPEPVDIFVDTIVKGNLRPGSPRN